MGIGSLALNAIKGLLPSPKTLAYITGGTLAGEGLYSALTGNAKDSLIGSLAEQFAKLIHTPSQDPNAMSDKDFMLKKSSLVLGDDMVNRMVANNISPEKIYETALQVRGVRGKNAKNPYGLPDYARNIDRYEIDDKGNFTNLTEKYAAEDLARWKKESKVKLLADMVNNIQANRNYTDQVVLPKKRYSALK